MIPPENKQDPTILITDSGKNFLFIIIGNNYKQLILNEKVY